LHQRVRGDQNARDGLAGFEGFGVIGQQRQDEAEAEQVDKDDQND
jgi:hypothetical protein